MALVGQGDPELGPLPEPVKPPDKDKIVREKQLLSFQISQLSEQLKCLNTTAEVAVKLLPLQAARTALSERHRQTDEQLRALAPRITEKRNEITKLRDKLKCRSEQQVDEQVRRLEQQIQTHHFRLREEEKIVREINDLKRSKRTLREYDAKKLELEQLSQRQRQLRHERDKLYTEMDRHRRSEERIQQDAEATAASAQLLTTELAELKIRLESIDTEYERQLEAWELHKQQQGPGDSTAEELPPKSPEAARRRPPRPPAAPPPPPAERPARGRPAPELHRAQLTACSQLMAYLQKLAAAPGTTPGATPATPSTRMLPGGTTPLGGGAAPVSPCAPLPGPATPGATGGALTPAPPADGQPPMFVLPRKEEATAASTPARPRRRRDRRASLRARSLSHSAEIYNQFCMLELCPPASVRDVPAALEQLKAKQKYYQMSALKAQQEGVAVRPCREGPPDLTLRLSSGGDAAPSPPPARAASPELVTLHSIGVQLPLQLTLAPPASHPPVVWPQPPPRPAVTWPARPPPPPPPPTTAAVAAGQSAVSVAIDVGGNPASSRDSSKDSGVPSAPLSAEVPAEPDVDPFAAALQSRLTASAAQRPPAELQVPAATP